MSGEDPVADFLRAKQAAAPDPVADFLRAKQQAPASDPVADFLRAKQTATPPAYPMNMSEQINSARDAATQYDVGDAKAARKFAQERGLQPEAKKLSYAVQSLHDADRAPKQMLKEARAAGNPDLIDQAQKALQWVNDHNPGPAFVKGVYSHVTNNANKLMQGVDAVTSQPIRAAALAGMGKDVSPSDLLSAGNPKLDSQHFYNAIKQSNGPIAKGYEATVGNLGNATGFGVGGLLGLGREAIHGTLGNGFDIGRAQELAKSGGKIGEEFAMSALADASLPFTYGLETAAPALERQIAKAARLSGLGEDAIKAASKAAFEAAPHVMGKVNQDQLIEALAAHHNIQPEALNQVLGKGQELAGRGGMKVFGQSVPGTEGLGLLPGKAGKALVETGAEKMAGTKMGDKLQTYADQLQRPLWQRQAINQKAQQIRRVASANVNERLGSAALNPAIQSLEHAGEVHSAISSNERAAAQHAWDSWVNESFGQMLPAETAAGDQIMTKQVSPEIKAEMQGHFEHGMHQLATNPLLKPMLDYWKEIKTTGNIGYMPNNVAGDSMFALASGVNPARMLEARKVVSEATPLEHVLGQTVTGETLTKKKILEEGHQFGFLDPNPNANAGKLDFDQTPSVREFWNRAQRAQAGKTGTGLRTADVMSLGVNRPGKVVAKKWDEFNKATQYIDRRMKGDSPESAWQYIKQNAFDFQDPGHFPAILQKLRQVSPFVGYVYRAIPGAVKAAARNPKTVGLSQHLLTALQSDDPQYQLDKAPPWMTDKQPTINTGALGKDSILFNLTEKYTGVKPRPGLGMTLSLKGAPMSEAAGALSDWKSAASISPTISLPIEAAGLNTMTGEKQLPISPMAMLNQGSTGHGSVEAKKNQFAWLSKLLGEATPSQTAYLGNEINRRINPGASPLIGGNFSQGNDPELKSLLQLLNLQGLVHFNPTTPGQEFMGVNYDLNQKAGLDAVKDAKKARKKTSSK